MQECPEWFKFDPNSDLVAYYLSTGPSWAVEIKLQTHPFAEVHKPEHHTTEPEQ